MRQDIERVVRLFSAAAGLAEADGRLSVRRRNADAADRPRVGGAAEVLMLDEPSMGLAPMLAKQLFETIGRIKREQGLTVLLVEQNARAAIRQCDYGYVMDGGRIVLHGTREKLSENEDVRET